MTTKRDRSLHELTVEQVTAVTALAAGATHGEAAEASGVHRVTVTRWANHHPAFIAELNGLRADNVRAARAQVEHITRTAMNTVFTAIEDGNVDAAFRWLRLGTLPHVTTAPEGPTESRAVVECVRLTLPNALTRLVRSGDDQTTEDAEAVLVEQLQPSGD